MNIRYLGAAAKGWPALFCSCPICVHARVQGGKTVFYGHDTGAI